MLKVKTSKSNRLTKYIDKFGKEYYLQTVNYFFCKIYEIKVASQKKFTVVQHIYRDKQYVADKKKLGFFGRNN